MLRQPLVAVRAQVRRQRLSQLVAAHDGRVALAHLLLAHLGVLGLRAGRQEEHAHHDDRHAQHKHAQLQRGVRLKLLEVYASREDAEDGPADLHGGHDDDGGEELERLVQARGPEDDGKDEGDEDDVGEPVAQLRVTTQRGAQQCGHALGEQDGLRAQRARVHHVRNRQEPVPVLWVRRVPRDALAVAVGGVERGGHKHGAHDVGDVGRALVVAHELGHGEQLGLFAGEDDEEDAARDDAAGGGYHAHRHLFLEHQAREHHVGHKLHRAERREQRLRRVAERQEGGHAAADENHHTDLPLSDTFDVGPLLLGQLQRRPLVMAQLHHVLPEVDAYRAHQVHENPAHAGPGRHACLSARRRTGPAASPTCLSDRLARRPPRVRPLRAPAASEPSRPAVGRRHDALGFVFFARTPPPRPRGQAPPAGALPG
mmetsp:Transcript_7291/g.18954  ORF Transcript_7291/g.18954 Transcript_7291/m.18954 type:complete len:428 (+) Transcript_7291:1316-2599(+)